MSQLRRKPGTPPKGSREPITTRVPTGHKEVYEQAAIEAGLPLSDYCAVVMAKVHGLAEPEYLKRNRAQQELPISA